MSSQSSNLIVSFEVYQGENLIKTAEFRESGITIGSGASAVLTLADPALAELHAVINLQEDGTVQLLDLGSDAGTLLNGESVSNGTLTSGATISIGSLRFTVNITDEKAFDDEEATYVVPTPSELRAQLDAQPQGAILVDGNDTENAIEEVTDPSIAEGGEYNENTEDVMSFVLRSGTSQSNLGEAKKGPKVLEVNQVWGDILIDTKHFPKNSKPITIGTRTGYKWSFLGVELGYVPSSMATFLPFTPPMWSEITTEWANDFYSPDDALPGGQDHNLFKVSGGQHIAVVEDTWDGFVDLGDERVNFDELVAKGKATKSGSTFSIPMDDDIRLVVDIDGTTYFSHMVRPGQKVLSSFIDGLDFLFLGLLALAAFLGLMFGLIIYFLPQPANLEGVEIDERFVELLLQKQQEEKKKDKKPAGNPDAGEGAKAKREEGKVGKKDAKMDKAKGNKVQMQKQQLDKQVAENAGVLGALRDGGQMDGFGGAIDANMLGGIGGLIGAKGTQIGSGGLGSRGSGFGGGGTADGLGGLGTKGIGSGASGYGAGGGNFGQKGKGSIGAVGGDPIILGALDRSLIDEVVKRHLKAIRYCYQKELTKSPNLKGKVVVKFVIAKDGSVSSASKKTSTMKSPSVESCVVSRFKRMQFPKPKGGGIVIVSYPFIFTSG
jgi:pSer/pThr/pTyr-binding forkhead associated (FHA) protein